MTEDTARTEGSIETKPLGTEISRSGTDIIEGVEETVVAGLTAEELARIAPKAVKVGVEGVKAVDQVLQYASESQKEVQATIRTAIDGKSDTMKALAENMKSDEARLHLAEIEVEREKEKTKQAETAAKANEDNNKTSKHGLNVLGYIVIGVVAFVFGGPKALAALKR